MRRETMAVHSGFDCDPTTKAVAVPIYQTVAYAFDSADHGAALFNLEQEGFRYSRISNPTNAILEQRVAELEGGVAAVSLASGQAALHYAIVTLADHGGNIVTTPQLYGTTYTLFSHVLKRQGIEARFAASDAAADIEALIDDQTRAVFCESVGNPAGNVCDIAALAEAAHRHGVPLIVDNTVATPILLQADRTRRRHRRALADQVHGRSRHGDGRDGGRWRPLRLDRQRRPLPDVQRAGRVLPRARLRRSLRRRRLRGADAQRLPAHHRRGAGADERLLLLQGIETVALRVERHTHNARKVAQFLKDDPRIDWVNYAGFEESPYFALANKYLGGTPPSLLTFGVKGGFERAKQFYDRLALVKRLVNIGDVKSLACHPASTTHRQMSPAEHAAAGVTPEMIRLCVGIEHADDIIADLDQALDI
jgi:O-acetylhomoserine (thiol)-lyase